MSSPLSGIGAVALWNGFEFVGAQAPREFVEDAVDDFGFVAIEEVAGDFDVFVDDDADGDFGALFQLEYAGSENGANGR